ncbi:MAG: AIR synthase family protein, partial [Candidatus Methanofastidiosia archaeon]
MKTGKLDPKKLPALVFKYLGTKTDSVIVGPSVGEDAAVLDFGDKKLIVSSDPITGAAQEIGFYAININANDVSVMGAIPKYFLPVILLSENSSEKALEKIMRDMDFEAKGLGISIVGGHTEVTPELENIVIVGTMLGITDRIITSSGAEVGNRIILTKGAGIEGTSILARDKYNVLKDVIDEETLEDAKDFLKRLSVVKEALISKRFATAMHDATEGGVQGGLHELCDASHAGFRVDVSKIKVRRETKKICE